MLFWAVSATLLALFVEWKAPGNRMGRVLLATGVLGSLGALAEQFFAPLWSGTVETSEAIWEGIGALSFFSFYWMTLALVPLLFPTGRPMSRRWGFFGWAGALALVIGSPLFLFTEQICTAVADGVDGCARFAPNPIGIPGMPHPEYSTLGLVIFGVLVVSMAVGVAGLIVRFVRSRDLERQQLKMLVYVMALNVLWVLLVGVVWEEFLGNQELPGVIPDVGLALAWAAIPIAIGLAISRYRLYDIDRIISRTVSYALVVGLLAVAFAAGVVWIPNAVPGLEDSSVSVAVSTLAVASLFNPVRRRVQDWVDRRFNRSRYDAERILEGFASSLSDRLDPDGVVGGWIGIVSETMQPSGASVWVRE